MAKSQTEEQRQTSQTSQAPQGETTTATAAGSGQQMARAEQRGGQMVSAGGEGGRQVMDLDRPWTFRRIFDEFDRMFEQLQRQVLGQDLLRLDMGSGWVPRMEVQDIGRELVLTVELPGFEPDEISIECTEDVLTIRGEHRETEEQGGFRAERTFVRQIAVPAGCDVEEAQASFRNGLLTIRLPRERENARQIPISTEPPSGQGQQSASSEEQRSEQQRSEHRAA